MQDYVSVVRRRWWLLLCPLVAVAAVATYTLSRPPSYTSTATVSALAVSGGPTGQYSGTAGAKTFVANFQAALRSPAVITELVRLTGVTPVAARGGLSSSPVGESTIIEVTYRTRVRAMAAPVATEAAKATMSFLFRSQVDLALGPLNEAEQQRAAVDQELADFTAKASTPVPDRDYQILADQISSLQTLQAESAARQEISIAARYGGEIAAKEAERAKLADTLKAYNDLVAKRSAADDAINASRQNLEQAKAQFAAGDPNRIVTPGETVKLSQLGPAAKGGITALVSGLFFAAGIALLLELRRSHRQATGAAGPAAHQNGPMDHGATGADAEPFKDADDEPPAGGATGGVDPPPTEEAQPERLPQDA